MRRLLACVAAALVVPAVLSAQSRVVRLESKVLGETRVLHISVPPNYRLAKQRYPVTLLLDGQARPFFELAVAAAAYDLTGDAHDLAMPAQIIVGIEQGERGKDLSSNDVAFMRFLLDELLPYIDREYRTLPSRTLIGHSLGGRFALLSLCRAPAAFSATIAISPSVSDSIRTAVEQCARAHTGPRVRQLVLSAGSLEARATASVDRLASFLHDSAGLAWRSTRIDGTGLGHTETPFYTIPDGLRFVFATEHWEIDRAAADSLLEHHGDPQRVLDAALARVSARMGFTMPASSKWMAAVVRAYLAQSATSLAVDAARRMVSAYPEEPLSYALLADAGLAAGDRTSARRALTDVIALIDKLDWFDETQRDKQRTHFREALAGIAP
jgi:predicted alpha/beta superfamily hydrolase